MSGTPNVKAGNIPHKKLDKSVGHQKVAAGKQAIVTKSSGKMPEKSAGVSLGTTKGNANVAHVL